MTNHRQIFTEINGPHLNLIMGIVMIFAILILVALGWFIYYYNENSENKVGSKKDSYWLEALWMIVPTILVLFMFFFGWKRHTNAIKTPGEIRAMSYSAPTLSIGKTSGTERRVVFHIPWPDLSIGIYKALDIHQII